MALAKRIYVSSSGVVAGPFAIEQALEYMRSLRKPAVAMDRDLVIYGVSQGADFTIEQLDMRNDELIDRIRREALPSA